MPRLKGSGALGPVRSLRLPLPLECWFEARLRDEPDRAVSDMLLQLVIGGLRLRSGYMARHRERLKQLRRDAADAAHEAYWAMLRDTFGDAYIEHLQAWIEAEPASETSISS